MWKPGIVVLFVMLAALPVMAQDAAPTPAPLAIVLPEALDRGLAAFDAQDYEQSILDSSLFLLFNPTAAQGYYLSALSHINLNEIDAALTDLDQALALDPLPVDLGAELYRVRGSIYGQQGDYDAAISDYSAALDLAPDAQLYIRRGLLYGAQNDIENALADFDAAVALDETNPTPYVYRALLYSLNGDTQLAAEDYFTFVGLTQTSVNVEDALESGGAVAAQLAPGQVLAYPLTVKAGAYFSAVAVSTDRSTPIDTLIILLDEDGNPLVGDDNSGGNGIALVQNFPIPTTGSYTLIVANSTGGGSGEIGVQMFLTEQPLTN